MPDDQCPLFISDLTRLKVDPEVVAAWEVEFDRFRDEATGQIPLTELQSHVLGDKRAFHRDRCPQNLIVVGPTSGGKTLIGQAIIASALYGSRPETTRPHELKAHQRRKALYLVPLRALVTENYWSFRRCFPDYTIVPSSTDYQPSEALIASGKWDIGVAVYDKVYRWLLHPKRLLTLLRSVDVIVIDEVQVLEHREQGSRLEGLLSFLRWQQQTWRPGDPQLPRIVMLATEYPVARRLAAWLDADLLPQAETAYQRPVPLYEGFLAPGLGLGPVLHLKPRDNNVPVPLDVWAAPRLRSPQLRANAVKRIAARRGKRYVRQLVYVRSDDEAEQLARDAAAGTQSSKLRDAAATPLLDRLAALPASPAVELLQATLPLGIGVVTHAMSTDERDLSISTLFSLGSDLLHTLIVVSDVALPVSVEPTLLDLLMLYFPERNKKKKGRKTAGRGKIGLLYDVAEELVQRNLRVLIYVADKPHIDVYVRELTRRLKPLVSWGDGIHPRLCEAVDRLEPTTDRDKLRKSLHAGVAYHHGDMLPEERDLVEEGFRDPEEDSPISVVLTTTSLSMGVNLSADVILLSDQHTFDGPEDEILESLSLSDALMSPDPSPIGEVDDALIELNEPLETWDKNGQRDLTVLEYRNFAGRAGRKGENRGHPFGLCLLLADDDALTRKFLRGQAAPLASRFPDSPGSIAPHLITFLSAIWNEAPEHQRHNMLRIIKGGAWDPRPQYRIDALQRIIQATYAWQSHPSQRAQLKGSVASGLVYLRHLELINDNGKLSIVGEVAARHFLQVPTIERLESVAQGLMTMWPQHRFELLWELADLSEIRQCYVLSRRLPAAGVLRSEYQNALCRFLRPRRFLKGQYREGGELAMTLTALRESQELPAHKLARLIRTFALWHMLESPFSLLPDDIFPRTGLAKLHIPPAKLRVLGETSARMVGALTDIWGATVGRSDATWRDFNEMTRRMLLLEYALHFQVPLAAAPLAAIVTHSPRRRDLDQGPDRVTHATYKALWEAADGLVLPDQLWRLAMCDGRPLDGHWAWDAVRPDIEWWREFEPSLLNPVGARGLRLKYIREGAALDIAKGIFNDRYDYVDTEALLQNARRELSTISLEATMKRVLTEVLDIPLEDFPELDAPVQPRWRAMVGGHDVEVVIAEHLEQLDPTEVFRSSMMRPRVVVYPVDAGAYPSAPNLPSASTVRLVAIAAEALVAGGLLAEEDARVAQRLRTLLQAESGAQVLGSLDALLEILLTPMGASE